MTPTVDNRVVELQFDNKQFEAGTAQTVKSLDNLKKSLELSGADKGINDLSAASKRFSLSGMAEAADAVKNRFSTMGIVTMTIIQNLTNSAIAYGKKLMQNFVKPITTGFQEYETQMNAVQTVLANTESKGTTLEDVTAALNELNTYADKTIYNFTEMTRNIGTFTAAGVDLETSTAAIKGIANLAAVSGSNSQQASTAMYQLSQALSSGTVKLMDWNSVVNAGMGGQVFQDALKETARVSGIAIDSLIDKHGSFRETLSTGWLSSQVLLDTLSKFTGDLTRDQLVTMGYTEEQIVAIERLGQTANDAATKVKTFTQLKDTLAEALQSGWTQSWQLILGDFEEAKEFFTGLSDIFGALIGESANARNKLLETWNKLGGRSDLIQGLMNILNAAIRLKNTLNKAFKDVFPKEFTGFDLWKITNAFKKFTETLLYTYKTGTELRRIFRGVFSIFGIAKDIILGVAEGFRRMFSTITDNISTGGILPFLAKIGDAIFEFRKTYNIFGTMVTLVGFLQTAIFNLGTHIKKFAGDAKVWLGEIGDKIKEFMSGLGFDTTGFDISTESIKAALSDAGTAIETFIGLATGKFEELKEIIRTALSSINIDTSGITGFFKSIKDYVTDLKDLATADKEAGASIGDMAMSAAGVDPMIQQVLRSLSSTLKAIGSSILEGIKSMDFTNIFKTLIAGVTAGGVLSIAKGIKDLLGSGKEFVEAAAGIFKGVTDILNGVKDVLKAYQQEIKSKVLLNIAIAVALLAASLLAIALIPKEKLMGALGAITGLFANLTISMKAFDKTGVGATKQIAGILAIASAMLILAFAMRTIAGIDEDAMWRSLQAIGALLAGIFIFSKLVGKNSGDIFKGSSGLATFAISLTILTQAVGLLGNMDLKVLRQGLEGIGWLLAEVAIFMKLVGNSKVSASAGVGLLGITASLVALSFVVQKLGDMDADKITQGIVALGAVLLEIGLFTRLVGTGKGMIQSATGMVIISGAMLILAQVVAKLADLSWEQLARGLVGLAGSLGIVTIALRLIPKDAAIKAASLVIVAGAMTILQDALSKMGDMSWESLGKGLLGIAASLGILVVALNLMNGTLAGSAALVIAAGALWAITGVIITLGALPIGTILIGLAAIAGVFVLLGAAGYLLTPVVPTLLAVGTAMLMMGAAVALIGAGLALFALGLTAVAAAGAAAGVAIVAFITSILSIVPLVVKTLIDVIAQLVKGIIDLTPKVGQAISGLLKTFLQIIIDNGPKLFEALDVIIKGLLQLIKDNIPVFVDTVITLLLTLLQNIASKIPDFVQAGFDILIGFLQGIRDNIAEVVTVVVEIVTEFLGAVTDNLPDIIQSGWDLMLGFINGLADSVDDNLQILLDAVGRLVTNIIEGLIKGIVDGGGRVISSLVTMVMDAFNAAKKALLMNSPSKLFMRLGYGIPEGMALGVDKLSGMVGNSIGDLIDEAAGRMAGITGIIAEALDGSLDLNPSIRPVLDISNILDGSRTIDDLLSNKSLNLVPAYASSGSIASSFSQNSAGGISGQTNTGSGTNITFEQYNYSPKELSRIEIYRQTNNQLRLLKGVVGST